MVKEKFIEKLFIDFLMLQMLEKLKWHLLL